VAGNLFIDLESHERHGEIQGDEIGAQRGGFFEGFGAVDRFATNFKVVEFEEGASGAPHDGFVFYDENALGHTKVVRG
jgi:hypothetical protein